MKAFVDATRCRGFGACVDLCPSVFQPDEWSFAYVVGDGEVAPADEAAAREAERTCPEQAIRIDSATG